MMFSPVCVCLSAKRIARQVSKRSLQNGVYCSAFYVCILFAKAQRIGKTIKTHTVRRDYNAENLHLQKPPKIKKLAQQNATDL